MITINRYIVLVGEYYYPSGWNDFVGSADTVEDAIKLAKNKIKVKKTADGYMKLYPESNRFETDGWCEIIDLSDYSRLDYTPSNEQLAIMYIERQEKENVNP